MLIREDVFFSDGLTLSPSASRKQFSRLQSDARWVVPHVLHDWMAATPRDGVVRLAATYVL